MATFLICLGVFCVAFGLFGIAVAVTRLRDGGRQRAERLRAFYGGHHSQGEWRFFAVTESVSTLGCALCLIAIGVYCLLA